MIGEPLNCSTCDGDLTIDGVEMRTPAWCLIDLTDLWNEAEQRGVSRVIPGAGGVISLPKRRTITRYDLEFVVTGRYASDGTPYSDPWDGLYTNIDYLNQNVVAPPGTALGTRAAVLTLPDGSTTLNAEVMVTKMEPREKVRTERLFVLTLELPFGRFA